MSTSIARSLGIIAASALLLPVAASSNDAGFLALPLTKHHAPGRLTARQAGHPLEQDLLNQTYLVDIEIGTPKQKVQLAVDLIYTDTVVMGSCNSDNLERPELEQCIKAGTYNSTMSETANSNKIIDNKSDGYNFEDNYEYDDFTIGGYETLKNFSFVNERRSNYGYFGYLGLDFGRGSPSTSIIDNLVDQNIITSKSFGLTLGSNDDSDGSLIFGGVDTKKFTGSLHKIPIEMPPTYPDDETHYYMKLEGVSLDDGAGNVTRTPGYYFLPYTIGQINHLPQDIAATIANAFGVYELTDKMTGYKVDCDLRNSVNGSVALEFPGGFNVSIPYREFVIQAPSRRVAPDECWILSSPRSEEGKGEPWSLSHSFLRSVYAVFDQEEKNIWLAKYQDCGSEVVKFEGKEIQGQCGEGSGSGGSGTSNTEDGRSGSSNGETHDGGGGNGGSAGARAGVAMGAVVFAAAMSLFGL